MSLASKVLNTVVIACALLSVQVSAHVHLSKTVPAAKSVTTTTPEKLVLGFTAEVKVIKLKLTDATGESVDFGFKPVVQSAKRMEWSLPALAPGEYQVNWTVLGTDGHKMEGSYTFGIETGHEHQGAH